MSQFSNDATGRGQLTYSFLPLRLSPSAYHKKRSRGAKVQQLFSPSRVSKWFEPRVAAVSKGRLGLTELEEKWAEWSDSGFAEVPILRSDLASEIIGDYTQKAYLTQSGPVEINEVYYMQEHCAGRHSISTRML